MSSDSSRLTLHPIEARVLWALSTSGPLSFSELSKRTGLDIGAVAKSVERLTAKGLVSVKEVTMRLVAELSEEGLEYSVTGFPERRLVDFLRDRGGRASLEELGSIEGMSEDRVRIGVLWAKKNGWVEIAKEGGETTVTLLSYPDYRTEEEQALEMLRSGPRSLEELGELARAVMRLSKRAGIVRLREEREHVVETTSEGVEAVRLVEVPVDAVSQLTPELIKTGRWRSVHLIKYDVLAPVKPVFAAREHPLTTLIRRVREVFVELGFEEVQGPLVELAFWNFDALFQPQDHPAREMHDTFYLEWPSRGSIPERHAEGVKLVHETGGDTGSRGWRYKWSFEEASRLILRTHTTATTIRYLAEHREPPVKVFSVDRIFRNEKVNWKRLAEFHQIEGILMDRGVGFRHLMGIIKEFYARLGLREVRFRPSYFPYTEPSAEVDVYFRDLGKWVELGGMGVFRPEVTRPLGVQHPVLA
ncbi:MAG: phenylalanine--tRNA ligase subunit alpha, partial [Thaumarchaeota archaeon]|nr:phenylalanine--tRNA ligase subunit alpha [Candidatus Calditenuaceae archaeon]MDW8186467.1 phenylalanine--tRNA ligase subunit alpha [Nitrososphaerota archaeon]